ncbi:MAG: flagellar basal body P-ring formation chaperone FlgA [Syntrophobacteraceae bacterium]
MMMRSRILFGVIFFLSWLGYPEGQPARAAVDTLRLEAVPEVHVDHKRVNLLDLFRSADCPENIRLLLGKTDIGEAPAVGSEKVIHGDQLKAYLNRLLSPHGYDSARIELRVGEKIIIRRSSVQVSKEEIEAIYREFIATRAPWDAGDAVVKGVWFSGPALELPAGTVTHEVVAAPNERYLGNVAVTIHFVVDGEKERSVRVSGKVDVLQNVVHAMRAIRRNELIQSSDVEFQRISISDAPDRFATQMDQVVGKRMLREVGFHQPIALVDLDRPLTLKRGSAVSILYEKPGLKLSAKGQAKEEGSAGDTIRVLNVTTNKIILCQIVDETTVRAMP